MLKKLAKKLRILGLFLALPLTGIALLNLTTEALGATQSISQEKLYQDNATQTMATLMAQRLQLSEAIAIYTWNNKLPIINPDQEKALVDQRVAEAKSLGIDEELVQRFFIAQADALNAACIQHFEKWVQADLHKHLSTPDIEKLRLELNQVDHRLMESLKDYPRSEDKVALIKALQEQGLPRDVIDASIDF
ncbi:MAG: hypothetical protein FJZ63_07900 [Chlamydiae bacterium]|nr:hypothetical protein [Chlamydiota bacterium]